MAIRKLRYFDDEILRKKCRRLPFVDDKARRLLDDMVDTMNRTENCGALAAPQVGILKRLVVVDLENQQYKLANPEIIYREGEQFTIEGCVSFPNIWGKTRRPRKIVLEALNYDGELVTIEAEGVLAKCFCHEIDHLNGEVFIDKIEERVFPS